MNKFLFSLMMLMAFQTGNSQSVFELVDSLVVLEKTIDFENVHWYGEIVNVVDTAEVSMQWKLRTPNGIPVNWVTNFDPGIGQLTYVTEGDSARFTLFKELQFLQKLTIGVKHNGDIGTGRYEFDLYPRDNPGDLKTQIYEVTFKELTSVKEITYPEDLLALTIEGLLIKKDLRNLNITTLEGRKIYSSPTVYPGQLIWNILPKIFVVVFEYQDERYVRKFINF